LTEKQAGYLRFERRYQERAISVLPSWNRSTTAPAPLKVAASPPWMFSISHSVMAGCKRTSWITSVTEINHRLSAYTFLRPNPLE
jgi:hypothetical protein